MLRSHTIIQHHRMPPTIANPLHNSESLAPPSLALVPGASRTPISPTLPLNSAAQASLNVLRIRGRSSRVSGMQCIGVSCASNSLNPAATKTILSGAVGFTADTHGSPTNTSPTPSKALSHCRSPSRCGAVAPSYRHFTAHPDAPLRSRTPTRLLLTASYMSGTSCCPHAHLFRSPPTFLPISYLLPTPLDSPCLLRAHSAGVPPLCATGTRLKTAVCGR